MYIFKPKYALLTLQESEKFKSSMYALQSFQPTNEQFKEIQVQGSVFCIIMMI